jgi:type I restriction enzyme S subunit
LNSDAAVPGLNREQAHSIEVLHPPLPLIERYAELVEPLGAQIEVLTQSNERLRAARDVLLPKLMAGEIDLSAAENDLEVAA